MSLLDRLNSRFGRYAVPNVTLILIAGQVLLFVADQFYRAQGRNGILNQIRLDTTAVLHGEVWRLITFLFDPPLTNVLFAFFFWYLFYLMGTTLETTWGAFRYDLFLAIGYFASLAVAFGTHFLALPGAYASNAFLYGTVFLAFARMYPDFTLLLFFILPVKIKWLALLQWIGYGLGLLFGTWPMRAMIFASVFNFLLFFGRDIWRDMKHGHRRMRQHAKTLQTPLHIVHKCHVCGATSEEHLRMQFRYCSKCVGQYAYCPEHLHDHEHVEAEVPAETRS
jgi:hypothetical protein